MSKKIIGVTVGTPTSPATMRDKMGALTEDGLAGAINTALSQAKESGEFDGKAGKSGVYVGPGDMPEDCNVQIDPTGDVITMEALAMAVTAMLPRYDGEAELV